jgi:hypothetical protein
MDGNMNIKYSATVRKPTLLPSSGIEARNLLDTLDDLLSLGHRNTQLVKTCVYA